MGFPARAGAGSSNSEHGGVVRKPKFIHESGFGRKLGFGRERDLGFGREREDANVTAWREIR